MIKMSLNKVQITDSKSKLDQFDIRVKNLHVLTNCNIISRANVPAGKFLKIGADGATPEWDDLNPNFVPALTLENAQFVLENIENGTGPNQLTLSTTDLSQLRFNLVPNLADPTADPKIVIQDAPGTLRDRTIKIPKKGFYLIFCTFTFTDQLPNTLVEFRTQFAVGDAGTFVSGLGRSSSIQPNIAAEVGTQTVSFYFPINTQVFDDYVSVKILAQQQVDGTSSVFTLLRANIVSVVRMA